VRYNHGVEMVNHLYSDDSMKQEATEKEQERVSSWIKVGAVAALSALAGGVTAAWFYRKTLTRLHTVSLEQEDSNFRTDQSTEDEI
jgi:flagellar basal body-associated protein FliL